MSGNEPEESHLQPDTKVTERSAIRTFSFFGWQMLNSLVHQLFGPFTLNAYVLVDIYTSDRWILDSDVVISNLLTENLLIKLGW